MGTTNPAPSSSGQPTVVALDAGVVLKISGIVSHSPWKKPRKIKKVALKVAVRERFTDNQSLQSMQQPEVGAISSLDMVVATTNDSFVGSTVLTLPQEGKYSILVQSKVIDSQNVEWLERKNVVIQVLVKSAGTSR